MLKFFTRLEKTRNFVLLIFAVLMVASLVFWGGSGIGGPSTTNLATSTETAATVSGEEVTVGELYRQKEMYGRFSQGRPVVGAGFDQTFQGLIVRLVRHEISSGLLP